MADTKREIERKYEGPAASEAAVPPDLSGVPGVADVIDKGITRLDATYYDTADQRLAADSLTLRRRTGGDDAGWHLKLPVADGVRDEIHAPLSETVPDRLTALARSRIRDAELVALVRLATSRHVHELVDGEGSPLAEVSLDRVRAERLHGGADTAEWTEIEIELADGQDPAFLDKAGKHLRKAGLHRSASPSKLAKALAETGSRTKPRKHEHAEPVTAGDHVLAYLRAQRHAVIELDPAVRLDAPDSVHRMRVATRRMRSTFRSFGNVLDRAVTTPVAVELKWLAGELGVDRDHEVLTERFTEALDALPRPLLSGPVRNRLRAWSTARGGDSRRRLLAVLDSKRYLDLLAALDRLLAEPPLREAAAAKPHKVLAAAVRKDFEKVAALVEHALDLPSGGDRDVAMHEARKKAKRTRYAAEAATPALGKPAKALTKAVKSLQNLLGEHQDSVMARESLRELADQAHAAGESTFTFGVLYGREEQRAAVAEAGLPGTWKKVGKRAAL
ncbi:CHAD domain-containing protein [Streptomyces sp. NPDC059785]|uniref:CYTH and CHAD domain-containing protein n=1 Tax=Streptomyces sp. NPDC059785 TaxID=3346945 RepID=UPI00365873EC